MSRPTLLPGFVAEVVAPGGVSGHAFVGKRFTLIDFSYLNGGWCWKAPESWSRFMTSRRSGVEWDLHIQEARLRFVHDGNVRMSWEGSPWKPHEEVIPDPRNPGRLVDVFGPVPAFLTGTALGNVAGKDSFAPSPLPPEEPE